MNTLLPSATESLLSDCTLCPRECHASRSTGQPGFCGETNLIRCARAALHYWEEPILSGTRGSGAVFFSGCNLRCVFCQNQEIASGRTGFKITVPRLAEIFLNLQAQGAHNLNLITGTPHLPWIRDALIRAKRDGLSLPVVWNSSGYESVHALRLLDGLIDIYLPDFKYLDPELAARYSHAYDYPERAKETLAEMIRQVGKPVLAPPDDGLSDPLGGKITAQPVPLLMRRGVIVRHLVLPGQNKDSKKILRYLHETYGDQIYISILNQYTPMPHVSDIHSLSRTVTSEEYSRVLRFAERIGIRNGFVQEGKTAAESFIPVFDGTGILPDTGLLHETAHEGLQSQ